jgi:hypothetical protein
MHHASYSRHILQYFICVYTLLCERKLLSNVSELTERFLWAQFGHPCSNIYISQIALYCSVSRSEVISEMSVPRYSTDFIFTTSCYIKSNN